MAARAIAAVPVGSAVDPCCCGSPPAGCSCALLIPINFDAPITPYSSISDAQTQLSDFTGDCLVWAVTGGSPPVVPSPLTATIVSSTQVDVAGEVAEALIALAVGVTVDASTDLSIPWTFVKSPNPSDNRDIYLYITQCADNAIIWSDSASNAASGTFSVTGLAAGTYTIYIIFTANPIAPTPETTTVGYSVISSTSLVANPVIALWDDSGTTRQLWACPKLLLPPLTESTGDWYASCADAATVLTGGEVSNCVGYGPFMVALYGWTFTATDGGTSLTLAAVHSTGTDGTGFMWGGINAVAGETLTFTGTVSSGTATVYAEIYDDTGTLVETINDYSPKTSSPLPYTGRYTLKTSCATTGTATNFSLVITSSGTMSVNPIQAVWDSGLTCPSRLDCGDSCP